MTRPIHIILFIILPGLIICNAQTFQLTEKVKIRRSIAKIVKGIARDNELKSESIGYGGARTEQWERYEKLNKQATYKELNSLTNHKNPVVRCYAFQALVSRNSTNIFPILLRHITDTAGVLTIDGCEGTVMTVADCFLQYVTPYNVRRDSSLLTPDQKATVDSILIFNKTRKIQAKYDLLSVIKPNSNYYNRIKEIATNENRPQAILALARFRNRNDIPVIKTLFNKEESLYYAAYSIREFPDTSFYAYLTETFKKKWAEKFYDNSYWRILYRALAKFPSQQTYEIFERTTLTEDHFRKQILGKYIIIAITKYPNSLFEPFKVKIKLDEYRSAELIREMNYEK